MAEIIQFPASDKQKKTDIDAVINESLKTVPKSEREKIRFELIKTIDSYDGFFTEWTLSMPEGDDKIFRKQIYDIAHQEHDRKMRMLKDIMRLKVQVLVAEYHLRK